MSEMIFSYDFEFLQKVSFTNILNHPHSELVFLITFLALKQKELDPSAVIKKTRNSVFHLILSAKYHKKSQNFSQASSLRLELGTDKSMKTRAILLDLFIMWCSFCIDVIFAN